MYIYTHILPGLGGAVCNMLPLTLSAHMSHNMCYYITDTTTKTHTTN